MTIWLWGFILVTTVNFSPYKQFGSLGETWALLSALGAGKILTFFWSGQKRAHMSVQNLARFPGFRLNERWICASFCPLKFVRTSVCKQGLRVSRFYSNGYRPYPRISGFIRPYNVPKKHLRGSSLWKEPQEISNSIETWVTGIRVSLPFAELKQQSTCIISHSNKPPLFVLNHVCFPTASRMQVKVKQYLAHVSRDFWELK